MKKIMLLSLMALQPFYALCMEGEDMATISFRNLGSKGNLRDGQLVALQVTSNSSLAQAIAKYLQSNNIPQNTMLKVKLKRSEEFQEQDWNTITIVRMKNGSTSLNLGGYFTSISMQNPIFIYFTDPVTAIPLTGTRQPLRQ